MLLAILFSIVVSAQLDSATIMMGDQTTLHLNATIDQNEKVIFPQSGSELTQGIEIVEQGKIDTLKLKDGRLSLTQDLLITSFQDSLFLIPPQVFLSGEDSFTTAPLSLNVIQPFQIDSADMAIADIKDIYRAPIWWWGIIRWVLLALLISGLGVGVYFLIRYLKRRKAIETGELIETVPLRPAHEVALEKLDEIKARKRWQQGEVKQYHTDLTDVIREYITRRFEVKSQEKTSDEILAEMRPRLYQAEQNALYDELSRMLRLSDLVKFAKYQPLPDENETSLVWAYRFVNQTKITETEQSQDAEKTSTDTDDKNKETTNDDNKES